VTVVVLERRAARGADGGIVEENERVMEIGDATRAAFLPRRADAGFRSVVGRGPYATQMG